MMTIKEREEMERRIEDHEICRFCIWHGYAGNAEACNNENSVDFDKDVDDTWFCGQFE